MIIKHITVTNSFLSLASELVINIKWMEFLENLIWTIFLYIVAINYILFKSIITELYI